MSYCDTLPNFLPNLAVWGQWSKLRSTVFLSKTSTPAALKLTTWSTWCTVVVAPKFLKFKVSCEHERVLMPVWELCPGAFSKLCPVMNLLVLCW